MSDSREYVTSAGEHGSINISEDVIALIAGSAALSIDGVASLFSAHGKEIAGVINKKGAARGVKIGIDGKRVEIDVFILAEIGKSVSEIGGNIQRAVKEAVESAAGPDVSAVNVHICGVSLKGRKQ
ncbi:MAG: Asp23/Gls24 family envelope stress response protein [Oscillospiraceae bacterium]|jgi:uncharacterized alkaline shock family protein YloU|nr:Asp23/Gls24 family envelope stress response protein [Oscillospiraceae bacterium]